MTFWIPLLILGLIAAWLIILPSLRAKPVVDESRQALNAKIFKQRMGELEGDFKAGQIDEESYAELKVELERNFLADMEKLESANSHVGGQGRWLILSLLIVLPIASMLVYQFHGYKTTVGDWFATQKKVDPFVDELLLGTLKPEELKDIPMSDFIYGLQRQAQAKGDEPSLWFVLGQTYMQLVPGSGNNEARLFESGMKALRRAYYLEAENTEYALSYAQGLIAQNQGELDIESRKVLAAVLKANPDMPSAVMMYAMASYQGGDYQTAIRGWERLLAMGGEKDELSKAQQILRRSIAQAKVKLEQSKNAPVSEGAGVIAGNSAKVKIEVELAGVNQQDLKRGFLMVYAQAEQGPPMPLAIKKLSLPQSFPVAVELSDQDAMLENMVMSNFPKIKLTARISATGNAMKQAGDWFGLLAGVDPKVSHDPYTIIINQQVK